MVSIVTEILCFPRRPLPPSQWWINFGKVTPLQPLSGLKLDELQELEVYLHVECCLVVYLLSQGILMFTLFPRYFDVLED